MKVPLSCVDVGVVGQGLDEKIVEWRSARLRTGTRCFFLDCRRWGLGLIRRNVIPPSNSLSDALENSMIPYRFVLTHASACSCSFSASTSPLLIPPHPDGPAHITFGVGDDLTFLQHLTPTLVSQIIHQPSHIWHSISPRLEAEFAQLLGRKRTSYFGWAKGFRWMSGGEEALKMCLQRRSRGRSVRGHAVIRCGGLLPSYCLKKRASGTVGLDATTCSGRTCILLFRHCRLLAITGRRCDADRYCVDMQYYYY